MEDSKTLKLIEEVIAKTEAGRIWWESSASEDSYFSVLPSGHTIIVAKKREYDGYAWYSFVLRDANRQQLLEVSWGPDGEGLVLVKDVYELAEQRALEEETRALKELDANLDKVLGELARL